MSDRFKFRVWAKPHEPTKTEGYYVNDADYIAMTPDGKVQIEYYYDNGYSGYIDRFEQDEVIVEQCTGLKDKNGKLIYEGDIVREISKREPEWEEYVIAIKWGYCGFNPDSDDEFDFEVIGNIHENPDLLEQEDVAED